MVDDMLPAAHRTQRKLAVLGDSLLDNVDWENWFHLGEVLDLRHNNLSGSELDRLIGTLTDADPTVVLVAVSATQGAAGVVDLGSVERTVRALESLQVRLRTAFPEADLVVQSIPPTLPRHARNIKDMNRHLRQFCATVDATFIDLWREFSGRDGSIKPIYSEDGVTLNSDGFDKWIQLVDNTRVLVGIRSCN